LYIKCKNESLMICSLFTTFLFLIAVCMIYFKQLSELLKFHKVDRLSVVKMALWTFCYHSRCMYISIRMEFYIYLDVCLWVVIVLKCVFAWEHIIIFPFLVALNQNINWAPGDFLSTKRLMNRTGSGCSYHKRNYCEPKQLEWASFSR
jgi:hypothetical protein